MANTWEFIQSWLRNRRSYNGTVNEYFENSRTNPNSRIVNSTQDKQACLIEDNDSALVALHKRLNFYFEVMGLLEAVNTTSVYGIPIASYQEVRRFKPQVLLYFKEDQEIKPKKLRAVEGQIQFRLMEFKSEEIPPKSRVKQLSDNIQREFASNNGYLWSRGRDLVTYTEAKQGYSLQISCPNKESGKEVVQKVLKVNGDQFKPEALNYKVNDSPQTKYPQTSLTKRIYESNYCQPIRRKVTKVRFQYALLHIHGLPQPIILADLTGRRVQLPGIDEWLAN
ncbi:MAG: hypothetical protein F6K09_08175 [Merismopedia sp. SIO2A8]|nr:hypothetical protein [Symploca sp. SIO2B6]NET48688.1 hypothetical protein [Merismopedia sp. SIO2A8]